MVFLKNMRISNNVSEEYAYHFYHFFFRKKIYAYQIVIFYVYNEHDCTFFIDMLYIYNINIPEVLKKNGVDRSIVAKDIFLLCKPTFSFTDRHF